MPWWMGKLMAPWKDSTGELESLLWRLNQMEHDSTVKESKYRCTYNMDEIQVHYAEWS